MILGFTGNNAGFAAYTLFQVNNHPPTNGLFFFPDFLGTPTHSSRYGCASGNGS